MKQIDFNGVSFDLAANIRGASEAPSLILSPQFLDEISQIRSVADSVILALSSQKSWEQREAVKTICEMVYNKTYSSLEKNHLPILLGGDHSVAIGSISAVSRFYKERGLNIGCLWIDAHADINTPETSPSGNIHGMPVACVLGEGFPELTSLGGKDPKLLSKNIVQLGIRAVDEGERGVLEDKKIKVFWAEDVLARGGLVISHEIEEYFKAQDICGIHLSFDIDGMDPEEAPGVSTPEPNGLNLSHILSILSMLRDRFNILSIDLVELNPRNDKNHKTVSLAQQIIKHLIK